MSSSTDALIRRARAWIASDPDPATRSELEQLIDAGDFEELRDRFDGELAFGTAGLRGVLGAGSNRMNRLVAQRATAGLAQWLLDSVPNAKERGVCIGYDGRHLSREIAEDVVAVTMGYGIAALAFEHEVPTPLVAFALLRHRAAAAVVVTASHNPAAYNGYKVFWGNGAQIVSPHDTEIAARIRALSSAPLPRLSPREGQIEDLYRPFDASIEEAYLDMLNDVPRHPSEGRKIPIVYSAMHGVGGSLLLEALARAGFENVRAVAEQLAPDPDFPTVAFPNPEEPGALDAAMKQAEDEGAALVLANDPDADRVAVAARDAAGRLIRLDGNEVGCLLADYLLREDAGSGRRWVVSSVVSSRLLGQIAKAHGAGWAQTLSGHKWIQNRVLELEEAGDRCIFSYEEALGYAPTAAVRDKDGIATALLLADLAGHCHALGNTLIDERDALARRHGLFLGSQVSIRLDDDAASPVTRLDTDALRRDPPSTVGGVAVTRVVDLQHQRAIPEEGDHVPTARGAEPPLAKDDDDRALLPSSDVLILELEDRSRVILRPSGTEPKLKLYFEVIVTPPPNEAISEPRERAQNRLESLIAAFLAETRPKRPRS